jgi:hypothetical protein
MRKKNAVTKKSRNTTILQPLKRKNATKVLSLEDKKCYKTEHKRRDHEAM